MIKLVRPTIKYRRSFLVAVKEFQKEGRYKGIESKQLPKRFAGFVRKLKDYARGIDLPKEYIPESIYWLVDGDKFIGRVSVRHRLTEKLRKEGGNIGYEIRPAARRKGYGKKILKLSLPKALRLGIKKALVTCDDDNIGSRKIIKANGGILKEKIKYKGKIVRHYWISIMEKE